MNSAIVIVCSPFTTGAEEHLKVSPRLSILSGFNIIKVFWFGSTGSIRTSPFILPLVKVFPFNDHTVSEGNGLEPTNPHVKQRVLTNGSANDGSLPKKNYILLWGQCCPYTSPTIAQNNNTTAEILILPNKTTAATTYNISFIVTYLSLLSVVTDHWLQPLMCTEYNSD